MSLHKLVHLPIRIPKAMRIPEAKVAVYKAWQSSKVRRKHEAIEEAHKESTTVQFATLMDICFLMDNTFQKHKGLVVLRGDAVKDDSGSCAVFTEQGSSASHMIAVKVFVSDCAGGTSDAVSAYTSKRECPVIWIRLSSKSWDNMTVPTIGKKLVQASIGKVVVGTKTRRRIGRR